MQKEQILEHIEKLRRKEEHSINARAITSYRAITNKKKSPPLIELKKILKGEVVIDNPKLRLSVDDYNIMCESKNTNVKKIMARVLNIDVKTLTAFCKVVKVLDKNIDLSESTIKEKIEAKKSPIKDLSQELFSSIGSSKILLSHLPNDVLQHIISHTLPSLSKLKYKMVKYKLIDGIPEYKLFGSSISKNPNALYYLIDNGLPINYFWLSYNTNPIAMGLLEEEMKVNPAVHLDWKALSRNPEAMKILKANRDKISWGFLSLNTNPKAMKLLEEEIKVNPAHINFESLAENERPEAMKIIEDNLLIENSIYTTNWNRFWEILSRNPKAIKILRANRKKIDWCSLCGNQSTEAIKLLEEEMATKPDIINWIILSGNPNERAFAILEANPKKINLRRLSSNTNPKAIELLEKRMVFENNLSEATYDSISTSDKIDWNLVSKNINAIELLKKRIIYEDNLTINRRRRLKKTEVIDWNYIAENPNIFAI
jgi:hypothetical protein